MSNQSVETVGATADKLKVSLAVVAVVAGIVGYFFYGSQPTILRSGILVAGLVLAVGFLWTSISGRQFIAFARDAVRETKKVVWPTRKEAMQVTLIVFCFVLLMAIFLWGADKLLEFVLYDLILGWKQ